MSHEAWLIIIGIVSSNLLVLLGGLIHLTSRLARIETDLKWIKARCPQCQQTSDPPTQ